MECTYGYKLNEDGLCINIELEYCLKLDENKECMFCNGKKLVRNGICTSSECSIDDCLLCTNYNYIERCLICKNNFVVYPYDDEGITKMRCVHENGKTLHCQLTRYQDP